MVSSRGAYRERVALLAGGEGVALMNGLSIVFGSATGHHRRDRWRIDVEPVNPIGVRDGSGARRLTVGQDGVLRVGGSATLASTLHAHSAVADQPGLTLVRPTSHLPRP